MRRTVRSLRLIISILGLGMFLIPHAGVKVYLLDRIGANIKIALLK